jgi:hypothetical protein
MSENQLRYIEIKKRLDAIADILDNRETDRFDKESKEINAEARELWNRFNAKEQGEVRAAQAATTARKRKK